MKVDATVDPSVEAAANGQSSFGLSGLGYVNGGGRLDHPNQWVNENIPLFKEAEIPRVIPNKTSLPSADYKQNTQQLFEFNARKKSPSAADAKDGRITTGPNFGISDSEWDPKEEEKETAQQRKEKTRNAAVVTNSKTVEIPQRPKSANPTSRGVTNLNLQRPLAEGTEGANKQTFEFVSPQVYATTNVADGTNAEAIVAAGVEDNTNNTTTAPALPRTREEALKYRAAARSSKELALKEKVFMRELKKMQV